MVCHHCSKQGHYKRSCAELANSIGKQERTKKHSEGTAKSGGSAGKTWCSHDRTTTPTDPERCAQGAPHAQGSTYTASSAQCTHSPADEDHEQLELNFDNDLDEDFLSTRTRATRTFVPDGQETSVESQPLQNSCPG